MTQRKFDKVELLSETGRFPGTFRAILDAVPATLRERLTAAELAVVVDFGFGQARRGERKGWAECMGK